MKDPLEYSIEELEALSTEELTELHSTALDMVDKYNTEQLTKKILINALYGATGNTHFPLYNRDYASGITANGRIFIQQTANMLREKFQELMPWSEEYVTYGDTDSCAPTTQIRTDKGLEEISSIYKRPGEEIEYKPGKFIKKVDEICVLSLSEDFVPEYKKVKYIMKHKVQKQLFKVKCNGKEVVITCDHSIMVTRGGNIISVKPTEIQQGDKMIVLWED